MPVNKRENPLVIPTSGYSASSNSYNSAVIPCITSTPGMSASGSNVLANGAGSPIVQPPASAPIVIAATHTANNRTDTNLTQTNSGDNRADGNTGVQDKPKMQLKTKDLDDDLDDLDDDDSSAAARRLALAGLTASTMPSPSGGIAPQTSATAALLATHMDSDDLDDLEDDDDDDGASLRRLGLTGAMIAARPFHSDDD